MLLTENSVQGFAHAAIQDHLFGERDGSTLFEALSSLAVFEDLKKWTDQQWREFMTKWLTDAHHVSILGVPSRKLSEKLKKEEKARVKAHQERLGEEGLKKLAEKLEQAITENGRPVPPEILEPFKVPGVESIHFIPTLYTSSLFSPFTSKISSPPPSSVMESALNLSRLSRSLRKILLLTVSIREPLLATLSFCVSVCPSSARSTRMLSSGLGISCSTAFLTSRG